MEAPERLMIRWTHQITSPRKGSTMALLAAAQTMYGVTGWTVHHRVREMLGVPASALYCDDSFGRFDDVTAEQARTLLNILPAANLDDQQNEAPMLGDLLRACLSHPQHITLSGYVVGPQRYDERVSVDALRITNSSIEPGASGFSCEPVGEERVAMWQTLAQYLGLEATVSNMPDEMIPSPPTTPGQGCSWWLWWD